MGVHNVASFSAKRYVWERLLLLVIHISAALFKLRCQEGYGSALLEGF